MDFNFEDELTDKTAARYPLFSGFANALFKQPFFHSKNFITMKLPANVEGLIKAQNEQDSTAFAAHFTEKATVADEGSSYVDTVM